MFTRRLAILLFLAFALGCQPTRQSLKPSAESQSFNAPPQLERYQTTTYPREAIDDPRGPKGTGNPPPVFQGAISNNGYGSQYR
jgi:hypothetical protein